MQTAQSGDQVRIHFVKRFQDGSIASSRNRPPIEMTIGVAHPRLPGLGLSLVGLSPGTRTTISVPAELGYGVTDPTRVHRWTRSKRFPNDQPLPVGKWVPILNSHGRRRLVRILEIRGETVLVDTNHRFAGQSFELEVELVAIQTPDATSELPRP